MARGVGVAPVVPPVVHVEVLVQEHLVGVRVSGFGPDRVSGFGSSRNRSDLRFRVVGVGLRVWGFRFQVEGVDFRSFVPPVVHVEVLV